LRPLLRAAATGRSQEVDAQSPALRGARGISNLCIAGSKLKFWRGAWDSNSQAGRQLVNGTSALLQLCGIVLKDDKSSTYKLTLFRILCRISDAQARLALIHAALQPCFWVHAGRQEYCGLIEQFFVWH